MLDKAESLVLVALRWLTLSEAGVDGAALAQAPAAWGPAAQVEKLVQTQLAAVD